MIESSRWGRLISYHKNNSAQGATIEILCREKTGDERGERGKDFLAFSISTQSKSNLREVSYNPPTLYCILSAIRPPPSNANASPY